MEPELVELTSAAALTFVQQLTTDAWREVVSAMGALWRRVHPDRAATVEADAAETREVALGDRDAVPDLALEWQGRLRRLVAADPGVAAELRVLLAEWAPDTRVTMHATASGRGRIVQAGRDAHVTWS
jgi:hypothetical protein